jgi:hypothetical protein
MDCKTVVLWLPSKSFFSKFRVLRIEFNHSFIDYYTGIDGVLLAGIKWSAPAVKVNLEQAIIKGIIQKKLENVHFKPQKAEPEFIKNDLSKFIKNVSISSSEERAEHQIKKKEKSISDLPYEVLFTIMLSLDLRDLYRCSQVCKSFQQISRDPLLFFEVNLKFYWNLVNSSLISSLTRRCSLIRKLDASSCGYFDSIRASDFVNFICTNGRSLTHLRLNSSCFLNASCIEAIAMNCSNVTLFKKMNSSNFIYSTNILFTAHSTRVG